jgi:hypothetical protein
MKNGKGDAENENTSSSQALTEYRKDIIRKRKELLNMNQQFADSLTPNLFR